jgi:hypothetical protein
MKPVDARQTRFLQGPTLCSAAGSKRTLQTHRQFQKTVRAVFDQLKVRAVVGYVQLAMAS